MLDLSDVISFLVGFCLPIISSIAVNHFGLKQENLTGLIEDLCDQIQQQADRACDYWSRAADDVEAIKLEGKIVGADFYIGAVLSEVYTDFPQFYPFLSDDPLLIFSDGVTGGNFQVKGRKVDLARGELIQRSAFQLCVALRRGRRATIFPPKLR